MSVLNNRDTLEPYLGNVWLTRPVPPTAGSETLQNINICVEQDGDFFAIGQLQLGLNGIYRAKDGPIGQKEDAAFRQYIEKLAGAAGKSEAELFDEVAALYMQTNSINETARRAGLSKERVRRILITKGMLTSQLISDIVWLHDGGIGKSVSEIAAILKVSEATVQKNMAYGT